MPVTEVRQDVSVPTLFERIREIAPVLEGGAAESEEKRYLIESSVEALHKTGLYKLWWPEELGGSGAGLGDGIAVIEAVAEVETSAAWNLAVGTTHAGFAGAYLADHAVERIYADERLVIAGQMAPIGKATPVEGGLNVSGSWSFGSGIHQANWVIGGALLQRDGAPPQPVNIFAPKEEAVVDEDSWQVAGLAATGSRDYSLDNVFIPDGYWCPFPNPPRMRGGPVFELPIQAQTITLHGAVALGAARRSLREITELAITKARSFSKSSIAQRPTFQKELAEAKARLEATRLYVHDVARRNEDALGTDDLAGVVLENRAACRFATDVALDVATWAYRVAGGSALRLSSPLQRILRDLLAASQHVVVEEAAYTAWGAHMVGVES